MGRRPRVEETWWGHKLNGQHVPEVEEKRLRPKAENRMGKGHRTRMPPLFRASCFSLRFSDLFSLAEEYEDSSTKPPKSRRKAALSSPRSRKNATQPPNAEEESGSSSASVRLAPSAQEGGSSGCRGQGPKLVIVLLPPHLFQEEEDTKPKPTKRKRKGSSAVGSDSD